MHVHVSNGMNSPARFLQAFVVSDQLKPFLHLHASFFRVLSSCAFSGQQTFGPKLTMLALLHIHLVPAAFGLAFRPHVTGTAANCNMQQIQSWAAN
jgi:hypothetical protein